MVRKQIQSLFTLLALIIFSTFLISGLIENLPEIEIDYPREGYDHVLSSNDEEVLVTRVIDGDTIEISGEERVRYIGIDAPENPTNKNADCLALESYLKNQELVLNRKVRLEKDISETDRYGRLLRYVYVGDTFVNEEMVSQGYALAKEYPPDTKYAENLKLAESKARQNNTGIWGKCIDGN